MLQTALAMPALHDIVSSAATGALSPLPLRALPSNPLVSILIGNFNYERYIGEAVESVLRQTYAHWELIICDDGSTDGSVATIGAYAKREARIRLVRQANGGHAAALNRAFSCSAGEIICLLDSDDLYRPGKVEQVVSAFAAQPERGLAIHRLIRVDGQRRPQGVWPLSDSLPEGWLAPELLGNGGIAPYMPPTSGLSLRREAAEALFPLATTPPLHRCPDQVLMRLAPLVTPVARILEPLADYRLHGSNAYTLSRITAASLSREIELSQALWQEQGQFLERVNVQAAAQHAGAQQRSSLLALLRYLRAKLADEPETRTRHREFLALSAGEASPLRRLFWSASLYLPRPVFGSAINLLLGQNRFKQILARIRKLA